MITYLYVLIHKCIFDFTPTSICFQVKKPSTTNKNQMVHSLTARSMSREFREGLKNNVGKTFNRNVLTTNDANDKCEEELNENGDSDVKNKLNNTISFWENV